MESPEIAESENISAFRRWLTDNGARIHPSVYFDPTPSGFSVRTREPLQPDITVVSTPFSLAITLELARNALCEVLGEDVNARLLSMTEREVICLYVCMHWVFGETSGTPSLRHFPYLNTLPSPAKLRTPLHFTDDELQAFKGTNLFGATLDRRRQWMQEWQRCKEVVKGVDEKWAEDFTWERYLTAATYLSSRAFPSSVLSRTPSLKPSSASYPVLLPGIDALNHSRAQPVSWLVTYPDPSHPQAESEISTSEPIISLVLHSSHGTGSELFNNYGPKPNSELILGYGFSLPNNPDDTIVLQLGGSPKKWEVARDAKGIDGVWEEVVDVMRNSAGEAGYEDDGEDWQDEVEAAGILQEMTQVLMDRLPPFPPVVPVREEVKVMLDHYLEGQRAILESIMNFAIQKEDIALAQAGQTRLDIVEEEEEEEESEARV